ncbi:MAG TPA: hypothetical protein P5556_00855 [Candidatus Gastranaerophilales bacterium]|nr:hypothetical protein [Candidatus Gastranaerophilales bacterium]
MKSYRMTDTWELEESYTLTEPELYKLAYDLYCGEPVGEELKQAKKEFGSDIPKVIAYVEKECGWRAETI